MTKEVERAIIEDYLSQTISVKDIGKKYNCSSYIVNKILKENNIQKYDYHLILPQNKRKFSLREDYFDIQSPNMAYILGILASDGTVRKNTNEIKLTLSSVDKDFLVKLQREVGGRPIKIYETQKGFSNATWSFSSRHIKDVLGQYNIVPCKTNTFKFPLKLEKQYWRDFIRGYFDGDGCISTAGPNAIRFQIGSKTRDVLEQIIEFFSEFNIDKPSIYKRQDGFYYFQYSSTSTRQIYSVLYYDGCLHLPRKKKKYEEILYRNNSPRDSLSLE